MGSGSFGARLAVFVAVAVLVAALSAVALWTREQARRLDEAVTSQVNFVLSEAKASLEVQLNLGLALEELPRVDGLLTRARAALPGIQSVAVLDEAGTVLFSTNAVEVGERPPLRHAADASVAADSGFWSEGDDAERVYGVGLATSFDTVAGSVLLRMPAGAMAEPMRHYTLTLAIGALLVALPVAFLAWLAGLWLARGPRRALSDLAAELEGLGEGAVPSRSPAGAAAGAAAGAMADAARTLGLPADAFADAVRRRLDILDEAEREVARLDELA